MYSKRKLAYIPYVRAKHISRIAIRTSIMEHIQNIGNKTKSDDELNKIAQLYTTACLLHQLFRMPWCTLLAAFTLFPSLLSVHSTFINLHINIGENGCSYISEFMRDATCIPSDRHSLTAILIRLHNRFT